LSLILAPTIKDFKESNGSYFIRLYKDENLFTALEEFADKNSLKCGTLNGIGALKNCELGFYHLDTKTYDRKMFADEAELLSLAGNLSLFEGKPFFHIHTVLGGADFKTYGGHLFTADVAVTAEIIFRPLDLEIERTPDESIGLNLLNMCGH
jgi:predicted DNA-binding protein with PD1-like motif